MYHCLFTTIDGFAGALSNVDFNPILYTSAVPVLIILQLLLVVPVLIPIGINAEPAFAFIRPVPSVPKNMLFTPPAPLVVLPTLKLVVEVRSTIPPLITLKSRMPALIGLVVDVSILIAAPALNTPPSTFMVTADPEPAGAIKFADVLFEVCVFAVRSNVPCILYV